MLFKTNRTLGLLLLCTSLTGCAWNHYHANLHVNTQAVSYLNPDIKGRASPLLINIYQLKAAQPFTSLNYDQLASNSGKYLDNTLLDKQPIEVRPDSNEATQINLSEEAKYIGIVASYRNINHATWRQIIKLRKPGRSSHIWLDCQTAAVKAGLNESRFTVW